MFMSSVYVYVFIHTCMCANASVYIHVCSEGGVATDILGGKSVSVHRLGCNDNGTMLPAHPPGELVKGGDMEAMGDNGPGQLLSNHHSGPWYAPEGGAEQDPLHPG